jgi:energy-coupling factor transporter ATP-binding protein EcfA2
MASTFAAQVRTADFSEGLVVAVVGPWGSGKTSFLNFVADELKPYSKAVVDFNPWLFSGAGELADSFFAEVAAQLREGKDLSGLSDSMVRYGEAISGLGWIPVVGTWLDRLRLLMTAMGKALQRRPSGVDAQRKRLTEQMSRLDLPLVVVLDDIDRLTSDEIRDVFRLVRVTAAFPNMIFVLAYDRTRVERALGDPGHSGREYLEKFVQVVEDLPRIPDGILTTELTASLNRTLEGLALETRFDSTRWSDIFFELIRPLVRNIRDVRRYCLSVSTTLRSLGDSIELGDVLALEAIRIFRPDLFDQIRKSSVALTTLNSGSFSNQPNPAAAEVGKVVEAADSSEYGRQLIDRLFPAASQYAGGHGYTSDFQKEWLRHRLVAHPHLLAFYLDRIQGEGLQAFTSAEGARLLLAAPEELSDFLMALTPQARLATIEQLEAFEGTFDLAAVVPGSRALLNLIPTLPDEDHGHLSIGPDLVVGRVVIRMLATAEDTPERERLCGEIYSGLGSLSAKADFLSLLEPGDDGRYSALVSDPWFDRVVATFRMDLNSADSAQLAHEREIFRIYLLANRRLAVPDERMLPPNEPEVTAALVQSARSDVRAQGVASRYVRVSGRLSWESLVEILGGESTARERILAAEEGIRSRSDELWTLTARYLSGDVPGHRDFDE